MDRFTPTTEIIEKPNLAKLTRYLVALEVHSHLATPPMAMSFLVDPFVLAGAAATADRHANRLIDEVIQRDNHGRLAGADREEVAAYILRFLQTGDL